MKKAWFSNKKGISVVEAVIATAIFSLIVASVMTSIFSANRIILLSGEKSRATFLAEEGLEAVRSIRDEGPEGSFGSLFPGTYGLALTNNRWTLTNSSDTTDIFSRSITITDIDTDHKEIISTVTWQQDAIQTDSVSLTTQLSNWMKRLDGDWLYPTQRATLDLDGNNNGIKIQVSGDYAFVVRDGGINFFVINVSNPSLPSVVSSLSLPGALSNIVLSGNYAYITSNDNAQELIVVNISNPSSPNITGTFNNPGNQNATGIYVVGSVAYVTFDGNNEFSLVNISNPSSPSLIRSLNLPSGANEVIVSGEYAYVVSNSDSEELQVIDVSTPSSPAKVASLDFSGISDAKTVSLLDDILFIGQGIAFHTVNIQIPTAPILLNSISTSGNINDISLDFQKGENSTYAYIASDSNTMEFLVMDVSSSQNPTLLGSLDISSNNDLNGVGYDEENNHVFCVGDLNTEEFIVFGP